LFLFVKVCIVNMSECYKCKKNFVAASDERIVCGGTCRRSFHPSCTNIGRSLYQGIKPNKNIVWYCDDCLDVIKDLSAKVQLIFDHLLLYDDKFNENIGKLDDLKKDIGEIQQNAKVEKTVTYAEKLKLARNDPVVIIKPKTKEKTGEETRKDVQKRIDPSVLPIKEMRKIAQG